MLWGVLLHLGTNMWGDVPVKRWGVSKPSEYHYSCQAAHLRFDDDVWYRLTERMAEAGLNTVVIDVGDGIAYESHPEIAVKGAWSGERLRRELARLRAMGLEPIPKLNFAAAHDIWLKEYARQLSTPRYYEVCRDLIVEVCRLFDQPRLFHLGFDEETEGLQQHLALSIIRRGELWWHDLLQMVATVEECGARAWIWADHSWFQPQEFNERMPRSVLQSVWFYGDKLEGLKPGSYHEELVSAFGRLDAAGFDQVPCGSNWQHDENFGKLVAYNRKTIAPSRLRGFLMAPWFFTVAPFEERLKRCIDLVAAARADEAAAVRNVE